MARLSQSNGGAQALERLRQRADRNQQLLMAVARGIRTVSRDLKC